MFSWINLPPCASVEFNFLLTGLQFVVQIKQSSKESYNSGIHFRMSASILQTKEKNGTNHVNMLNKIPRIWMLWFNRPEQCSLHRYNLYAFIFLKAM
jgi:hypothetical protein